MSVAHAVDAATSAAEAVIKDARRDVGTARKRCMRRA